MVGQPPNLLHYYSPTPMLHTTHASELLSFVDLFHHQHELGEDSAQIDVAQHTASEQPRYARRLFAKCNRLLAPTYRFAVAPRPLRGRLILS